MEQTRALNALEPFVALSKSANSPRAAADLVTQATSAPNTYVFAELLQTPNIQALRKSEEYSPYLTLLEIFSWGAWTDCKDDSSLPKLTPQQTQKLKLLSLLPLASSHSTLTYDHLISQLSLSSTRDLEDLVTTAIYSSLLTATLDPAHSSINVTSVSPLRDLAPGSLPTMQSTLTVWSQRCEDALSDLEKQVAAVKAAALQREKERRKRERGLEVTMAVLEEKGSSKRGAGGFGDDNQGGDAMDIDQEGGSRWVRSAKRGSGLAGLGGRRL